MVDRAMAPEPEWTLGLDEAGRGSLVGPLVVGGFAIPTHRLAELPGLGARDSKLLSADRREETYRRLVRVGRAFSATLSPRTIDRYVVDGRLNLLEAEAMARLIRRAGAARAYVDACDPVAERFGRLVQRLSGGTTEVIARHRADRDEPVVGAASIVAKVRRDRAVNGLRAVLGPELGSGYPSDRRTVAFVRSTISGGARSPEWLRASWETTARLMREHSARRLESFA
jgi:ribonuclease HII